MHAGLCIWHEIGSMRGGECVISISPELSPPVPSPPLLLRDAVRLAGIFFFLVALQNSGTDILCEGRYAALMAKHPTSGSDLPTWVNLNYWVGM